MDLIGVNELLERTDCFLDRDILLHGVLASRDGDVLIEHWPKSERSQETFAQIWLCTGDGAFSFNQEVLKRIEGKRVVVRGVVKKGSPKWPGDPGSYWRVHVLATELTEQKVWQARHAST